MKKAFRCPLFFVVVFSAFALFVAGVSVSAASDGKIAKYPAFEDGAHIAGPKLNKESLQGKVVLWEYWGINCGPCLASMPHLHDLYKELGARGRFIVVASHMQRPSPKVLEYIKEKGFTFPVYQGLSIPEAPIQRGIPHSVLVGADGKIIVATHPNLLYGAPKKAMKIFENGNPILPEIKTSRYQSLADSLVYGGKNLESKIAPLREKKDNDAVLLCKAFDRWKKEELTTLKALVVNDPLQAINFYDELKESLPEGTKDFVGKINEIRKDKIVVSLLDLKKKTMALELRKSQGKRNSERNIETLKKALIPLLKEKREFVKNEAKDLDKRLAALLR